MMNEMTSALVTALNAVNRQVPCIIDGLGMGTLPAVKQREFGGLLIALGELLKEYADAADDQPVPPARPDDAAAVGENRPLALRSGPTAAE